MSRLKARGSIERWDLGALTGVADLAGVTVALRHEGPGVVRRWAMRQQAWRLEEARRVRMLVESMGEDLVREVYADTIAAVEEATGSPVPLYRAVQTPEGQETFIAIQRDVVSEVAVELAFGPDVRIIEPQAIAEELERLGALAAVWLKAQEVQRLSAAQFPGAESAGDHGPGAGAAAGAGTRPAGGPGA